MIVLSILIVCIYISLMVYVSIGFNKVQETLLKQENTSIPFSILIPFRNEENNLTELIKSIIKINYPNESYEVIFINDESVDNSINTIKELFKETPIDYTIINTKRFSNSPKKDAITLGVKNAKFDWIVTTDADCIVPKSWLQYFSNCIKEKNPNLICGPVAYYNINSWLSHFQNFELLSLITFTYGTFGNKKPFLCNGANLCYSKTFFHEVSGYEKNNHIASGDDVFLLEEALNQDTSKVHFIKSKNVLVLTKAESTLKGATQQRIRWASKTSKYENSLGKLIGLIVLLMNGLIVSLTVMLLLNLSYLKVLGYCLFIKLIADALLIFQSFSLSKNQKFSLVYYFTSSLFYPFFSIYIAIHAIFLPYKWKDRRFMK